MAEKVGLLFMSKIQIDKQEGRSLQEAPWEIGKVRAFLRHEIKTWVCADN